MKKVIFIIFLIFAGFIINNLTHNIYSLWHKQDLILRSEKQLEEEKRQNQKLKTELAATQSQSFIEEEARNKLFLSRPGESTILIAQNLLEKSSPQKRQVGKEAPWQEWASLFGF